VKKRVPMSPRELSIRISERLCASTASTKRILWVPATSSVTGSSTHST
jgi:hypothetical protein